MQLEGALEAGQRQIRIAEGLRHCKVVKYVVKYVVKCVVKCVCGRALVWVAGWLGGPQALQGGQICVRAHIHTHA
jgi:uncharacterized membrane protein